jgi:hypothetical protein
MSCFGRETAPLEFDNSCSTTRPTPLFMSLCVSASRGRRLPDEPRRNPHACGQPRHLPQRLDRGDVLRGARQERDDRLPGLPARVSPPVMRSEGRPLRATFCSHWPRKILVRNQWSFGSRTIITLPELIHKSEVIAFGHRSGTPPTAVQSAGVHSSLKPHQMARLGKQPYSGGFRGNSGFRCTVAR